MCIYMRITTINEKGNHKSERAGKVIWEGLEGEKRSRKLCNYSIISKMKEIVTKNQSARLVDSRILKSFLCIP